MSHQCWSLTWSRKRQKLFLDHKRLTRHGMILTNWVHWTVKSHKIIQVSLYQITDDYWWIPINKIFWWGYYWGLLFNSHFTTPFYSFTYEEAFFTTILNCIVCNPKFFMSVLFCKKQKFWIFWAFRPADIFKIQVLF